MSMQAAQVALFAKLFWIWIGLLISVFVFWRLRRINAFETPKNTEIATPPYAIQGGRPWVTVPESLMKLQAIRNNLHSKRTDP